ncbi:hypothetical protein QJS10_CPB19g00629 [Acorus calamus]|uniref:Uncharacterized protein n=1 Tax=Acorus calamus TaxID=4465 RepID=A0AAV9CGS6_ACOCL|nr:hypothetical protein QJS10_CPB19g00629 [Acorus calamus]
MREVGANHFLWKKTLKVLNCSKIQSLSDWDLIMISESFPALEELDISKEIDHEGFGDHCNYPGLISDDGIRALVLNLAPCLQKINVSGNHMITDESLYALSWNCPSLSEVHVQDCSFTTEYGIASVIIQRPMLRAISMLWMSLPSWADARALQRLHIGKTNISDDILFSIARLQLKELCIPFCWGFSITDLVSLLRALPSLSHLDLSVCVILTDKSMALIAPHLREVITIDLSYCSELTELTFMCLVKCCPLLEEIRMKKTDLGRYRGLGDMGFHELETLKASYSRIEDEGLVTALRRCGERLRVVDLKYSQVTKHGMIKMFNRCPRLREGVDFAVSHRSRTEGTSPTKTSPLHLELLKEQATLYETHKCQFRQRGTIG